MRKRHLGLQQLGVRRARRVTHRFVLESLERRELLAGNLFTVTANTDTGTGSGNSGDLRYCITQVNKDPVTNHDTINFAVGGPATIALASALPIITTPITIDGTTEGAFTGVPLVTIDATKVASGASALEVDAGSSTIKGLSIIDSPGAAISLVGDGKGKGDDNAIASCFIGTADGTKAAGNAVGIQVIGSSANVIGGYGISRNVISGNAGHGISIADPKNGLPSNNNQILGNDIGVDMTGTTALANAGDGIYIDNSSGDLIDSNVVSGNQAEGIFLTDVKGICQQITITNNMIGTTADGTQGIGNGHRGVYVQSGSYITIGGINAGNVIADSGLFNGSTYSGIRLDAGGASGTPTDHTLIEGNKVGTDITGTVILSNGFDGIRLLGANNTTIGGTVSGAGNLVSGNWVDNIAIETLNGSPLNQNTLVAGNVIGLTGSGEKALGDVQKGRYGIYVTGANGATIGGTAANVISGNIQDGIYLNAGQNAQNIQSIVISGNQIGTDITGVKPVANRGDGIDVGPAIFVSIESNVIAGNATNGIVASSTSGLIISGNSIGTNQGDLQAGLNTKASFDGLGYNQSGGYVPPDTIAAVGRKYVVETINTTIRISNKNGGVILEEPLSKFFPQSQYGLFDPVVFYDDNSGRFVVAAMENQFKTDSFGFTVPSSVSYMNIAFSDPGNEGSFTYKYRITTTEANSWADFPRFGFNADAVVFTFNMFDASTGSATNTQILSIDKSSIGQTKLRTVRVDKSADFTDAPASMHGAKPGGPMYFMQSTNDFLKLDPTSYHALTWANPLVASSSMTDNELPVPAYDFPAPADQKGGLPVDTNDYRALSVAWRDNMLVVANTASVDASLVAKAHWYEWQTNPSNPASIPLLLQAGVIDPGPGVSTFFPAIDINKAGDIGLTYMESSSSEYVSMYVTGQVKGDPANTMRPPVLAQAGLAPYAAFDGSPYREGDFAGMGVDPVDGSFWAANEYATAPQPGANYGTWIQQFLLEPTAVNGIYLNLGNSGDGIQLNGVSGALIGGNTISANGGNGINADGGTSGLQVVSNLIGTDKFGDNLGNVGNGVNLLGSQNMIGGDGVGNTIAFNGVAGILVNGSGNQDAIAFNLIHDNGGLGISLGNGTTPTPNQPDGGSISGKPNNSQNYPTLTSAIVDTANKTTEIKGTLDQVPTGQYTIQFFANPAGDASGHGQGATYLGEVSVSASGGSAPIDFPLSRALDSGLYISAVAIGQTGNTSEFSATVQTQAKVELNLSGSGSSATAYPGDTLTYTYTVTNQGQNPATQVVFTDVLDPNTTFVSATLAGNPLTGVTPAGNTLTVNVGTLQKNASATVTVTVLVGPGNYGTFTLSNQASFTTFDANDPLATSQVTVPTSVLRSADVAITSVTPSVTTSYPTGTVTYTITATNNGPSDSSGGTILDTIPGLKNGYATFVSSSTGAMPDSNGGVTFTFGALKSGGTQTFTVTVSPMDQGVNQALQNSASITGSDHDPNSTNDTLAGGSVNIIPAVRLVAGLSGSAGTVQVGDPLTYTATVTNTSGVDATGVTLVDTLPSNVVIVSAPAGSQISGNTITVTIGSLPRNQTSAPVTIVVSPTSAAMGSPTITNAVQFKANEFVLNATQAQTSVTTSVIDRPGTLGFSSSTYSVPETAGSATLTVVRTAGQRGTITVHYTTVAVNATPGLDFKPVSGTLTFADGVTSQTIVVPVLANPYDRANELVNVVLSDVSPSGAILGTSSTATLTIVDTNPNYSNLTLSLVTWDGTASQINSLHLDFGMPLLPSAANNPGNYTLYAVAAGGGVSPSGITLSPSYDPSNFVVTLTPSRPLAANQFYRLVVNGSAPGGIQTLAGTMLAGDGTTPGTNYVASLATGTSLRYTTAAGDLVTINIRGGGYLTDLIDASGRGVRLQVVGEVPRRTVLTGTVKRGPHGTGRAYLGYTIYGLGNFGDVSVKMYSPPFQVDKYPLPTATRQGRVVVRAASATSVKPSPAPMARAATPAHRPFHAFR